MYLDVDGPEDGVASRRACLPRIDVDSGNLIDDLAVANGLPALATLILGTAKSVTKRSNFGNSEIGQSWLFARLRFAAARGSRTMGDQAREKNQIRFETELEVCLLGPSPQ